MDALTIAVGIGCAAQLVTTLQTPPSLQARRWSELGPRERASVIAVSVLAAAIVAALVVAGRPLEAAILTASTVFNVALGRWLGARFRRWHESVEPGEIEQMEREEAAERADA